MVVWSGSATHLPNCTRLWCSKYSQSTREMCMERLTCVAQPHTIGRVTRSRASAKSSTSVSGVPTNWMPFLRSRHLGRPQPLPPANPGGQKGHGPLARDISVCKLVAAISHTVPLSQGIPTHHFFCRFSRHVQRLFVVKAVTTHTRSGLVAPRSEAHTPNLSVFHPPRLVFQILLLRVALPVFRPLLSSYPRISSGLHLFPPLQSVGFVIVCSRPAPPSATGNLSTDRFLVFFFLPLLLILLLHFMKPIVPSLHCIYSILDGAHSFLQSAASDSLTHHLLFASMLPFAFIFLVMSVMIFNLRSGCSPLLLFRLLACFCFVASFIL